MELMEEQEANILLVDDDQHVLRTLSAILVEAGYQVSAFSNGPEAISEFQRRPYTLAISDIVMPGMNGIEVLRRLHEIDPDVPVIIVTASPDLDTATEALRYNAFDFLTKPFKVQYVLHVVKKAIESHNLTLMRQEYDRMLEKSVREKTEELRHALERVKSANIEVIYRLTRAAEYKDEDTASHIKRIGHYADLVARSLGLSQDFIEALTYASPMHDVGKIGIPDSILFKPASLTPKEFEIAKQHVIIGAEILSGSDYFGLQMAERIALSHHERWDGTGYPLGLKGEKIPLEARIVMLVDQYDALRNKRPYKAAMSHEEACHVLTVGDHRTRPSHFDPALIDAFTKTHRTFNEIFESLQLEDSVPAEIQKGRVQSPNTLPA